MGRDFHSANVKRCYACGNWEGNRTFYSAERKVKVDDRESANCHFWHKKTDGSDTCEQYVPMA